MDNDIGAARCGGGSAARKLNRVALVEAQDGVFAATAVESVDDMLAFIDDNVVTLAARNGDVIARVANGVVAVAARDCRAVTFIFKIIIAGAAVD